MKSRLVSALKTAWKTLPARMFSLISLTPAKKLFSEMDSLPGPACLGANRGVRGRASLNLSSKASRRARQ